MHIDCAYRYVYNDACLVIMQRDPVRTTLNIDDELLHRAQELTGIDEKTALVRQGLEALIARESARRLAKLGGSDPDLKDIPRRRSK